MLELVIEEVRSLPAPITGSLRGRLLKNLSCQLTPSQAGSRFTEEELHDILGITQQVFDEEEATIPKGVEYQQMDKIPDKLLGASKKRRKARRRL